MRNGSVIGRPMRAGPQPPPLASVSLLVRERSSRDGRLAGIAALLGLAVAGAAIAPALVSGQAQGPPTVTAGAADRLHVDSARLRGSVDPNGSATTYHFEYGPTAAYGSQTPVRSAGAGTSPVAVSATADGLDPGSTYHYRLVASGPGGTGRSADRVLQTLDPRIRGRYSVTIRITAGGKPFGQRRGKRAHRRYRFRARCEVSRCASLRLVRGGKRGKFGSRLRRRDGPRWSGIERYRGRCDNGLRFRTRNRIKLRPAALHGDRAAVVTGRMKIRAKGCIHGKERATFRGEAR